VELGVIEKRGSFFSYGEQRIGQGKENARQLLKEHPELAAQLEQEIRTRVESIRMASGYGAAEAAGNEAAEEQEYAA
jgi:recombination protein RecA